MMVGRSALHDPIQENGYYQCAWECLNICAATFPPCILRILFLKENLMRESDSLRLPDTVQEGALLHRKIYFRVLKFYNFRFQIIFPSRKMYCRWRNILRWPGWTS